MDLGSFLAGWFAGQAAAALAVMLAVWRVGRTAESPSDSARVVRGPWSGT